MKKFLKPQINVKLVRFGNNWDGGYLIPACIVDRTEYLISFGVGYDWSFEKDFKAANKNLRVFCYDHTVTRRFWYKYTIIAFFDFIKNLRQKKKILKYFEYKNFFNNRDVFHYKKKVTAQESDNSKEISLKTLSKINKYIFLKIDIDNDEWRIIHQLKYFKKLLGLVIELHNIDLHFKLLRNFLKKNNNLKIAYIHANNMGGISINKDPLVIELTLLNTNLSKNYQIGKNKLYKKHKLDFKNDKFRKDINIRF